MLGGTDAHHRMVYLTRSPKERQDREQTISKVRQALGEKTFQTIWEEGIEMTLEEAIAYALEGEAN